VTARPPDFDSLLGPDVPEDERARLRRVHELLVTAGPPPEFPSSLETPPAPARIVWLRRRKATWVALAAALAVAAFAGGFLLAGGSDGSDAAQGDSFELRGVVPLEATSKAPAGAWGRIELGKSDGYGNWPMLVKVEPLPEDGYYVLMLTSEGRPVATCGTFKVRPEGPTTARLGASYRLRDFDGWVIRPYVHDRPVFNKTVFLKTATT
jgi:hypothetical protein